MSKNLSDTHPIAEQMQLQLIREKSVQERFKLLCSLTHDAIYHARRAIERQHPELTPQQRSLLFIEQNYGKDLAHEVAVFVQDVDREFII